MLVSMNTSAFMHLFARRSYAHAKVSGCPEQLGHVSPRIEDGIIVAINSFKTLGHVLTDLSLEILNFSRGATVKLVVDLDRNLFHDFKVALKSFQVNAGVHRLQLGRLRFGRSEHSCCYSS